MTVRPSRGALAVLGPIAFVAGATGLVWLLEQALGVENASAAYLLAVTGVAVAFGTLSAVATAAVSFIAYNFLFTHPRFTLVVAETGQLLNLVLLFVVGIVVGQLAGAQRQRAEEAERREREARVLFRISRALAGRVDTPSALRDIAAILRESTGMDAWVGLGSSPGAERSISPEPAMRAPSSGVHVVLQRRPGDEPSRWMRVLPAGGGSESRPRGPLAHRVPIIAGNQPIGSLWVMRPRDGQEPARDETRMLAAAADQIGLALEQDRLRREAQSAELARESEAMKSALLESVSHDLRTPLAAIRAAAGLLLELPSADEGVREQALAIDADADDMNRLVGNLLEISRIEAGGFALDLQPNTLDDLVETAVRRLRQVLAGRTVEIDFPSDLPFVLVDALQMDQVLANLLENAAVHAPGAAVRVSAGHRDDRVWLMVEDGGPGVPEEELELIFRKFYRVRGPEGRSRRGTGVGLAVVRGLVESMGGTVSAARSSLGGLAVSLELAAAPPEPEPEPLRASPDRHGSEAA